MSDTLYYRDCNPNLSRFGWSKQSQYWGQHAMIKDFPLVCRSYGKGFASVNFDESGIYVAQCDARHVTYEEPIDNLTTKKALVG